jgi:hypothetical protein
MENKSFNKNNISNENLIIPIDKIIIKKQIKWNKRKRYCSKNIVPIIIFKLIIINNFNIIFIINIKIQKML